MTENQALKQYDELLDELYPVTVGNITMQASTVLKNCDPIAYRTGFSDYIDSEEIELSN